MNDPLQTLEAAAAAIKTRQQEQAATHEAAMQQAWQKQVAQMCVVFAMVYPALATLLKASGITTRFDKATNEEDIWCDLIFEKPGYSPLLFGVTNYSVDDFRLDERHYEFEALVLRLAAHFAPENQASPLAASEQPLPEPVAQPAYPAGELLGHQAAFRPTYRGAPHGEGLSKLEYFAGQLMQAWVTNSQDIHQHELARYSVESAKALLAQLAQEPQH